MHCQDIVSEHPERFFVAEIIREKIFMQYRNEVPYACQVWLGFSRLPARHNHQPNLTKSLMGIYSFIYPNFQVNVVNYKTRPNAKDFIQVEIVVEKDTQKIILIGKVSIFLCQLDFLQFAWFIASVLQAWLQKKKKKDHVILINIILNLSNASLHVHAHVLGLTFDSLCPLLLKGGKALKVLATAARLDIEDFLQKKVFLEVPT